MNVDELRQEVEFASSGFYRRGYKYCSRCGTFMETASVRCPECGTVLRVRPRKNTLKELMGIRRVELEWEETTAQASDTTPTTPNPQNPEYILPSK